MNGAIIAAAVIRARRRIIERLTEAGAVSEKSAIEIAPKRRLHRKALEYLCREGIVVEAQPGRYFVHTDRAEEWHDKLHRRAYLIIVAVLAIVAVASLAAALFATG
jgi:hypothetical protein